MVVLWITSLLFPEAKCLLEKKDFSLSSSGGWVVGAAEQMEVEPDVELHIACPAEVNGIVNMKGRHCAYHIYKGPMLHDWPWNDDVMLKLYELVKPDIIHIWGTEYSCAIAALRAGKSMRIEDKMVISIQGLIGEVAKHYCDGLSVIRILKNSHSFRTGIFRDKYESHKRGVEEKETFRLAKFVIGRTQWDREMVMRINPSLAYFHCDEILRKEFYKGVWRYENSERYRIFHSNGSVPYKGLHQVLKSLPIVIEKCPTVKLVIAGPDVFKLAKDGNNYAKIVVSLIAEMNLYKYVEFCGPLNAQEMKMQLLKTNLFLLSSAIENSSNALCEAQLLGVPVVSSNRGGTSTIIPNENCGLIYPYDNPKTLAEVICRAFEDSSHFDNSYVREMAHNRHNVLYNQQILMKIYREMLG